MKKKVTVVLIDDDEQVLAALQRAFQQGFATAPWSLSIESYSDPQLALKMICERAIGLVICDYRMPGFDGVTLLGRIARTHPDTVRVLLTGSPDLPAVLRALNDAGVSRVLLKPWDNAELVSVVKTCLEGRDMQLEQRCLADGAKSAAGAIDRQQLELRRLEAKWPGLTHVKWTEDGAVQLGDTGLMPLDSPPESTG